MNTHQPPPHIHPARSAAELDHIHQLFVEYADQLGVDLTFQGFQIELDDLPGEYAEPRGALLLANVGDQLAGCCAMRPSRPVANHPNAAEMKRLFVRPGFRGLHIGRLLATATIQAARQAGYDCMLLDTLDSMAPARALYARLGFKEIAPYYHNPLAGAHYLKLDLKAF